MTQICLCGITKASRPSSLYNAHVSPWIVSTEKQDFQTYSFYTHTHTQAWMANWLKQRLFVRSGPRFFCCMIFLYVHDKLTFIHIPLLLLVKLELWHNLLDFIHFLCWGYYSDSTLQVRRLEYNTVAHISSDFYIVLRIMGKIIHYSVSYIFSFLCWESVNLTQSVYSILLPELMIMLN